MTGRIFDIRRYSIHDGPGIRTAVFFKGCPLHCLWCHNPEGVKLDLQLMHWPARCARCGKCLAVCPKHAISRDEKGAVVIDRSLCNYCGRCASVCLYEAMQIVGRDMTVEEVVAEAAKDKPFYEQSGGGVTLTGGEPFLQSYFLEDLVDGLAAARIDIALDTCGFAPAEDFKRIVSKSQLVLFDLKIMDEARHREFTGVSNKPIVGNFRALAAFGVPVWVRVPLVPGATTDDANIAAIIALMKENGNVRNVGLLTYHANGLDKADRLADTARFRRFEALSDERYNEIEAAFTSAGFEVRKGG